MTTPYDPYPRDDYGSAAQNTGQGGVFGSAQDAGPYGPYGPESASSGPYGPYNAPSGGIQDAPGPGGGPYGVPPAPVPYGYAPAGGPYGYAPAPGFAFGAPGPAPAKAGEAISRAFTLFGRHGGVLVGVTAIWGVALFFLTVANTLFGRSAVYYSGLDSRSAAGNTIFVVTCMVTVTAQLSLTSGALRLVRTGRVSFAEFFVLPRTWWVYTLTVGLLSAITSFIPTSAFAAAVIAVALVAGVAIVFAPFHLADAPNAPFAAFVASARMVADNLGQTLLLVLIGGGLYLAGAVVCGLGLLAVVPIITVSLTLLYCGVRREIVAP